MELSLDERTSRGKLINRNPDPQNATQTHTRARAHTHTRPNTHTRARAHTHIEAVHSPHPFISRRRIKWDSFLASASKTKGMSGWIGNKWSSDQGTYSPLHSTHSTPLHSTLLSSCRLNSSPGRSKLLPSCFVVFLQMRRAAPRRPSGPSRSWLLLYSSLWGLRTTETKENNLPG